MFLGPPFAAMPFEHDLDYSLISLILYLEDHKDWTQSPAGRQAGEKQASLTPCDNLMQYTHTSLVDGIWTLTCAALLPAVALLQSEWDRACKRAVHSSLVHTAV